MKKNYKKFAYVKNNMYLCTRFLLKMTFIMGKERTLALFKQNGLRLQLLEIKEETVSKYYHYETDSYDNFVYTYQVRKNRQIIETSNSVYPCKKVFANLVNSYVLQLKFELS